MDQTEAIFQAAQALGEALNDTPELRAYRQAAGAVAADAQAAALESEVNALYEALITRQRAGETLSQAEVDDYYSLRGRLAQHPLIVEREERLKAVRELFQGAGGILSSTLTMDYTALALEDE